MGYNIWPDTPDGDVLHEIHAERLRQEELKRAGKFAWTCADLVTPSEGPCGERHIDHAERSVVLAEEVGEASREVMEMIIAIDKGQAERARECVQKLRKELVQIAAVAVAWCEAIDMGAT